MHTHTHMHTLVWRAVIVSSSIQGDVGSVLPVSSLLSAGPLANRVVLL